MYTSCGNRTAVKTDVSFLWCTRGDSGQTLSVWWELKMDQSRPLTIWPYMTFILRHQLFPLHRMPLFYNPVYPWATLQVTKECNHHLFWWFQKTSIRVSFNVREKQQKWSYGYRVDLGREKKKYWRFRFVSYPPHIPLLPGVFADACPSYWSDLWCVASAGRPTLCLPTWISTQIVWRWLQNKSLTYGNLGL